MRDIKSAEVLLRQFTKVFSQDSEEPDL